ncbi:MAG TPA: DUF4407 domain-containing protein [Solirubrobacterales bacterium]|nr:DUF4407 domain-containing protein [Solirubrobacterales bacterium]
MSELMLWLSGADPDVLRHCERERGKLMAMGGTVATTSVLATIAATFTVHQFLHAPLLIALILGIGWGLAIMNLDRWLLMSIRRQDTPGKTILMAIPRIVLALLIGAVIAEPLVLRVFEPEVTAQAIRDKQQARAEGRQAIKQQYASIATLQGNRDQLQAEVTGVNDGAAVVESPAYREAEANLRRLESKAAKARHAAACERDGRCGSEKQGAGPAYAEKNAIAERLEGEAATVKSQVESLEARLLAQEGRQAQHVHRLGRNELDRVRSQLRELRKQRAEDVKKLREAFAAPIGLLDRVEALGHLSEDHPSMLLIRLLLFFFILAVDTMPALAKVLMSLGKPSLYEQVQLALEASDIDAIEKQAGAYAKANEVQAQILVDEATARQVAVKEVQDELVSQAVDGMREAGERFVAGWREAVVDSVDDLVDQELRRTGLRPSESRTGSANGGSNGSAPGSQP